MSVQRQFQENHILALLPGATYADWVPHFEIINLPLGKVLYEPGAILGHVYFPTTAIISWIYVLSNGASTEVVMTGREGLVGMYQLMGGGKSHNRAMVQTAGQAVRLPLSVALSSSRMAGSDARKSSGSLKVRSKNRLLTERISMPSGCLFSRAGSPTFAAEGPPVWAVA